MIIFQRFYLQVVTFLVAPYVLQEPSNYFRLITIWFMSVGIILITQPIWGGFIQGNYSISQV